MNRENKNFAERALKKLLIGSQIDGFQFGSSPGVVRVYFTHFSEQEPDLLWLTIEIRKIAIITNYERLRMISKENLEELDDEESFQLLLRNRREKVKDVWLGDDSPHLYIALESGKVLYVNGHHENYEESYDINDQLLTLLNLLKDKEDVLIGFKQDYELTYLFIIVIEIENNQTPAMCLEKEIIDYASIIGAKIHFDLYVM